MNLSQFVAFKSLFNERLHNALQGRDIEEIGIILENEYHEEIEGIVGEVNIGEAQHEYESHLREPEVALRRLL